MQNTPMRGCCGVSSISAVSRKKCWWTTRKVQCCRIAWGRVQSLTRASWTWQATMASRRPYRAQTKGKDERMVGYIKQHFFVRYRAFESLAHLNALAEHWLREEADQRVHGTVKEVVSERFAREQ